MVLSAAVATARETWSMPSFHIGAEVPETPSTVSIVGHQFVLLELAVNVTLVLAPAGSVCPFAGVRMARPLL